MESALKGQEVQTKELRENTAEEMSMAKKVVLALQHLFAMFGATVLVPLLTGIDPSVALVSAGVGTLIFHQITGKKVPVFVGSSFAFIAGIVTVSSTYGDIRYAQGGIIVAGLIYVLASFVVKKIGVDTITKYLPSHVVGTMIMAIGLGLLPVATADASGNWIIALITLGTALAITFFGKGFTKQLSILIALVTGYVVTAITVGIDFTPVAEGAMFAMPAFTLPKFDMGAIMIIAPVALAVFMEHLGDIKANGAVVGKDFVSDPGLDKTLLGDGVATIMAGVIGAPPNTTYGENTGVLAVTKNYDPSVLRLAAVFAIILGFVGKMGGLLNTIPGFVMGGISMMLFSMIAVVGFNTIRNDKTVQYSVGNVVTMILVFVIGTGIINPKIILTEHVSIAGLALAAIVGILLNVVFNYRKIVEADNERATEAEVKEA